MILFALVLQVLIRYLGFKAKATQDFIMINGFIADVEVCLLLLIYYMYVIALFLAEIESIFFAEACMMLFWIFNENSADNILMFSCC